MLVVNTQHAKIKCFNLGSHATIILYCNIVEILKTKTYFHFISFIWHWKSIEKVCKSDRSLAFECCLVFYFMAPIGCKRIQDFQTLSNWFQELGIIWLSIVGKHIVPIVFYIITAIIMAQKIFKKNHISRRYLHKLNIRNSLLNYESWIHPHRKLWSTISWKKC